MGNDQDKVKTYLKDQVVEAIRLANEELGLGGRFSGGRVGEGDRRSCQRL